MRPVRQGAAPRVTCTQTSMGRSPVHTSMAHRAATASTWARVAQEPQPVAGGHTRSSTGQRPSPEHALVCAGHSRACAHAAYPFPLGATMWKPEA
jgi:hypothetical protein